MRVPRFQSTADLVRGSGGVDYLTERGAKALSATIATVWAESGHPQVRAWPEAVALRGKQFWTVRTDLRGGLPREVSREDGAR